MSDAIVISTEWDEFKSFDWNHIYNLMKKPLGFLMVIYLILLLWKN